MASKDGENGPRDRALAGLERFLQRLLPYHLRRSSRWRHASTELRRQLAAELRQELTLECLLCAEEIDALPEREQNRRWFQRTDRWLYRERFRIRTLEDAQCEVTCDTGGFAGAAEEESHRLARSVGASFAHAHDTGQAPRSVTALATRTGTSRTRARVNWSNAANRLGYGPDYFAFWRRRLAEALTGLAADLLLDAGVVATLPRKRRAPDPAGRRRRIRRILRMLAVAPMAAEISKPVAHAKVRRKMRVVTPSTLLEAAERLDRFNPAIPFWRFEAAIVDRDFGAAAQALRRARTRTLDEVAVALGRARLLAARGRVMAASALLRRAHARRPRDARLCAAMRAGTLHARGQPATFPR